jgi:hypothetical protein
MRHKYWTLTSYKISVRYLGDMLNNIMELLMLCFWLKFFADNSQHKQVCKYWDM